MPITFIIIFSPKSHFRSHVFFSAEHLWPSPWTQLEEKFNGHLLKCARKQLHVTNVLIVLLMLSTTVLQSSQASATFDVGRPLLEIFLLSWSFHYHYEGKYLARKSKYIRKLLAASKLHFMWPEHGGTQLNMLPFSKLLNCQGESYSRISWGFCGVVIFWDESYVGFVHLRR